MRSRRSAVIAASIAIYALLSFPLLTSASHSWGNYHWARTSNPFSVKVVDSNTSNWDSALNLALADWSQSSVLDMIWTAGSDAQNTRKKCSAVTGQVRSCNATYGYNGWLGLASISITGGVHITRGTSKMNDSYFNSGSYSATNRRHVMCQELGHTIGLGHTSEDGSDQNTCMDYSRDLGNPSPNAHDLQQLSTIYSHTDSTTTVGFSAFAADFFGDDPDAPHNWGQLVSQSANGRSSYYENDHGNGIKIVRHVFWTEEAANRCRSCDHRYHDH